MGIQALRLYENLMRIAIGETHDLVLDRGAVSRPDALDCTGIERRTRQTLADYLVTARIGRSDVGTDLLRVFIGAAEERKYRYRYIARLGLSWP
ncbi:MAG: hypothetical protein Ct9H300mP16_04450 [Pseudomonadota bacterium]|nr:MAG: hypothetical protein Ct9H300mP16_04450 [Pseudomonadota bacterium]